MKTLYMVRHAKSSWEENVEDHQRPLKERGISDAKLVSRTVSGHLSKPDQIITSDAVRALTTAVFFKDEFHVEDDNFHTNHELYDFSGQQVMGFIKNLSNTYNIVMIVGHNHAFTSIANMLGNKHIENMPTCGFIKIVFDSDNWAKISTGKTEVTIFPRDLKE